MLWDSRLTRDASGKWVSNARFDNVAQKIQNTHRQKVMHALRKVTNQMSISASSESDGAMIQPHTAGCSSLAEKNFVLCVYLDPFSKPTTRGENPLNPLIATYIGLLINSTS